MNRSKLISVFCIFFLFQGFNSLKTQTEQKEPINIHIVPHSHDDAGWLYTADEYYTGNNCEYISVKNILDDMVISLYNDPTRTFVYAEMFFFEKWFSALDEETKQKVRNLVTQKRLEFVNGGWVMNDEATVNYQHVIDQMRLGLRFLKREFNFYPTTAWYIDPFGHSATNVKIILI